MEKQGVKWFKGIKSEEVDVSRLKEKSFVWTRAEDQIS
jgi:hypothetical protein